jgi:NOL1/NOP2/fmu family ribosome biogenesis protein
LAEEADRNRLFSYLTHRFGISQTRFAEYLLLRKERNWFLLRETAFIHSAACLKASQAGLRAFQEVGRFVKPTTRLIQSFGRFADRAILHIDLTRLQALVRGEKIPVDLPVDNGYVILVIDKVSVLGLGLYVGGKISSQLPRREIRDAMLVR